LLGGKIGASLGKRLNVPVHLFNDVVSAAAGEAAFGAGRGHPDFVCIFIGTGIGGAVYRDGVPYRGSTNTAGELGHMVIDQGGRLCGCGGKGHLEAYASRTAIVRSILGALRLGRRSSLSTLAPNPDPDAPRAAEIRSRAIAEAVGAGDPVAVEMVSEAARSMGAGLVSIINFYNPPRIILGGGVVDVVDLYFDLASAIARQEALAVPRGEVEIVKTALGDDSGIAGAAVLAANVGAGV
jgi:glucokinase